MNKTRIALGTVAVSWFLLLISGCLIQSEPRYLVKFQNRPCIKPHARFQYATCKPLYVRINDDILEVPADFSTDLASIPRWLWPVLSPQYSAFVYPAIAHDYLYLCPSHVSRRTADDIFYYALLSEGVSQFTASKMWLGVRVFGKSSFRAGQSCKGIGDLKPDEYLS